MKITSVKKVGNKYLLNNKILVPLDKENKFYGALTNWLEMNKDIELAEEPADQTSMSQADIDYSIRKNRILNSLGNYDKSTKNTWQMQHMEAILHLYIKEAPTPFLDGLSEAVGETKRVLAKKILSKSSDYMYKLGKATGQMQVQKKAKGA